MAIGAGTADSFTGQEAPSSQLQFHLPLAVRLANNRSARPRLRADFVDQGILELVNSDSVRRFYRQPFVANSLLVSIQPCGKKRFILDLRHGNRLES